MESDVSTTDSWQVGCFVVILSCFKVILCGMGDAHAEHHPSQSHVILSSISSSERSFFLISSLTISNRIYYFFLGLLFFLPLIPCIFISATNVYVPLVISLADIAISLKAMPSHAHGLFVAIDQRTKCST